MSDDRDPRGINVMRHWRYLSHVAEERRGEFEWSEGQLKKHGEGRGISRKDTEKFRMAWQRAYNELATFAHSWGLPYPRW